MVFNWLLIAGLPFDPAPDPAKAGAMAAACRRKWSMKATDQRKGPYYRTLLDQADRMEADLSDKDRLASLAQEARGIAFPHIDASLRFAAGKGRFVPQGKLKTARRIAVKRIQRQTGIGEVLLPDGIMEARARALGLAVGGEEGEVGASGAADRAQRAYERFAKPAPAKDAPFKADIQLALYGAADLYEFACPPGCSDPHSAASADLVRRAGELSNGFKQSTERKSTLDTLAQKAKEVFGSDDARRRYDEYLKRRAVAEVLEELRDCAALSDGVVEIQVVSRVESALRRVLGKDADEAPYVIKGFCRAQRPPLALARGIAQDVAPVGTAPARTGASGAPGRSAAAGSAGSSPGASGATGFPASCDPVVITGAEVANDALAVRIEPPASATGFVVLTRPDRFARSLSDTHPAGLQTRHEIPREMLERDGALVVPGAWRLGCYVTVYAEYRAGGKIRFSKGCDFKAEPAAARAILYRIDSRKVPFRAPKVQVTLAPDGGGASLPEAVVVYAKGALPLTAEGAPVIARIPARHAAGPVSVEIEGLPNARDLYVRVFAASGDPGAFALAPGSFCKVS